MVDTWDSPLGTSSLIEAQPAMEENMQDCTPLHEGSLGHLCMHGEGKAAGQ